MNDSNNPHIRTRKSHTQANGISVITNHTVQLIVGLTLIWGFHFLETWAASTTPRKVAPLVQIGPEVNQRALHYACPKTPPNPLASWASHSTTLRARTARAIHLATKTYSCSRSTQCPSTRNTPPARRKFSLNMAQTPAVRCIRATA